MIEERTRKDLQSVRADLASKGMRLTKQRQVILEIVQRTQSHPDADWIYEQARKRIPHVSLGTIYRTLGLLRDSGLLRELQRGATARYDGNTTQHHHLTCIRCGRVSDVTLAAEAQILQAYRPPEAFRITDVQVDFFGFCSTCQAHHEPSAVSHQLSASEME